MKASMLLTTLDLLEGEKTTLSPTFTFPDSMRPAKMRLSSPWLVKVKRIGFLDSPWSRPMWRVWCPCCRAWEVFDSFGDAMAGVASILPGVRP